MTSEWVGLLRPCREEARGGASVAPLIRVSGSLTMGTPWARPLSDVVRGQCAAVDPRCGGRVPRPCVWPVRRVVVRASANGPSGSHLPGQLADGVQRPVEQAAGNHGLPEFRLRRDLDAPRLADVYGGAPDRKPFNEAVPTSHAVTHCRIG